MKFTLFGSGNNRGVFAEIILLQITISKHDAKKLLFEGSAEGLFTGKNWREFSS